MSDDVILLSSDDEFESPPPKKFKHRAEKDIFAKLHSLKEINLKKCEDNKTFIKSTAIESSVTIIIENDEKSKENHSNVVNLIDDPFEEIVPDQIRSDENICTSECFVVGSDSETDEKESKEESEKSLEQSELVEPVDVLTQEPNGILENGHKNENKKKVEIEIRDEILNRPSTSKASDAHKLLDEFLETCSKSLKSSKYECRVLPKYVKLKNNFNKCESLHDEPNFKKMLQEYTETARISAPEAVVSFQRIYSYLLDNIKGTGVEVSEEELRKLRMLEKTCKKILIKLKKLEEAEMNFDDEEDSSYMQIDRYTQRLSKVYNKYCQLLKKNPHAGRLVHDPVYFTSSQYNEINRAITKLIKNNQFPSYYDIEKCIRRCINKQNLSLSETEIKEESKDCFTKLGKLLQMRRKKDLYEVHCGYIALNEDPANKDEELKVKLHQSLQEGDKRMKEVVDKFVKMQENNVTVELSEDTDDSNYRDSDSEPDGAAATVK